MIGKRKTLALFKKYLTPLLPPIIIAFYKGIVLKVLIRSQREIENAYSNSDFLDYYFDRGEDRKRQLESGEYLRLNEITPGLAITLMEGRDTIKVLDFGGGTGNLFHAYRHFLPTQTFIWNVVETPELVERITLKFNGETIKFGNSSLQFYSSINQVLSVHPKIDIVIAASSLQYTQNPYETLTNLINIGADVLQISRMPFTQNERLLVFQQKSKMTDNGPQTGIQNSDIWIFNTVRVPNLYEFKSQFARNFFEVTTIFESPNGYPDLELNIPLYTILGRNNY